MSISSPPHPTAMRHNALRFVPFVVAITACASHSQAPAPRDAGTREALFLTTNETAPGRHCRVVDPGVPLPNVAAVLDTAAIPEYVHQIGMAGDTGYAVLSLRYDSTGQPTRERMIEYTVPDSLAQSLRSAIASALLPRPAGSALAARLRIDLGPTPHYRLGKSEYCEPEVIVVTAPPASVDVASVGRSTRPTGGPATASVYRYTVDVSPAGDVLSVNFNPGVPPNLVEALRAHAMHERWKPAIDDGLPVSGLGKGSVTLMSMMVSVPAGTLHPAP
jgi:hypothetical protein